MAFTEATAFDRKSGEGEGPAVRPGSSTKVSVPLVLPQNRHPERLRSEAVTLFDFSREVIDQNEFVIPTGAKRSGEPALSEAEGNLRFLFWFFHKIVILSEAPNRFIA
jgi:hypothetical protein